MDILFDSLSYDTEALLCAYRGHRQVIVMPSFWKRRCWVFISKDIVDEGFLRRLPRGYSLIDYGPSPCNQRFLAFGCTWGNVKTALATLQNCSYSLAC